MLIYTLWQHDGSEVTPWIVAVCDEFQIEEHGGYPPDYANAKAKDPALRELVLEVPHAAVLGLFKAPVVAALVKEG